MTTISDLSFDLVEEIISRVPLTSIGTVRSTCKRWNVLCKDQRFTKKHCGAMVMMTWDNCDCCGDYSRILNLHNIKDLPSVKKVGKILPPVQIVEVYPCDGLLLCRTMQKRLVLWNPYLAQTRFICYYQDYDMFAIGYDNNNNHKVLRLSLDDERDIKKQDIYDCKSNSWRVLDSLGAFPYGISLKGNTYFFDRKADAVKCFDFTMERCGPPLHLPFHSAFPDQVKLSSVRDEQLAVLFQRCRVTYEIEFWITTEIEPNAVSWTKLLRVDMKPLCGSGFQPKFGVHNFFVDKEKKLAVVCGACQEREPLYNTSYVVGEDGYYEEIGLEADVHVFSYVPSTVPIRYQKK